MPGVGRVEVFGGTVPEVKIEVQPDTLRSYGVTLDEVATAVRSQYVTASGGQVKSGSGDSPRGASPRFDARGDVEMIAGIPIVNAAGANVELRNVATVSLVRRAIGNGWAVQRSIRRRADVAGLRDDTKSGMGSNRPSGHASTGQVSP